VLPKANKGQTRQKHKNQRLHSQMFMTKTSEARLVPAANSVSRQKQQKESGQDVATVAKLHAAEQRDKTATPTRARNVLRKISYVSD
jgi:hypothetical protein